MKYHSSYILYSIIIKLSLKEKGKLLNEKIKIEKFKFSINKIENIHNKKNNVSIIQNHYYSMIIINFQL